MEKGYEEETVESRKSGDIATHHNQSGSVIENHLEGRIGRRLSAWPSWASAAICKAFSRRVLVFIRLSC